MLPKKQHGFQLCNSVDVIDQKALDFFRNQIRYFVAPARQTRLTSIMT